MTLCTYEYSQGQSVSHTDSNLYLALRRNCDTVVMNDMVHWVFKTIKQKKAKLGVNNNTITKLCRERWQRCQYQVVFVFRRGHLPVYS